MSDGTVVLTGANGTIGLSFVASALKDYHTQHLVLTVRNDSHSDTNTAKLYAILSQFPDARYTIFTLDLASLSSVSTFVSSIAQQVSSGALKPISAIVCNAFAWSLTSGLKFTSDGYELSFQVNYLAHFVLVRGLLDSMDKTRGRVVGMSSDSHAPGGSPGEVFPPTLPDDIEALAKPPPDTAGEEVGRGMQRYGMSKLCIVMFIYELNRRLQTDPAFVQLKGITALAVDPGTIPDSRATNQAVPATWRLGTKYILNPLQPVLKYIMPSLRKSSTAGAGLARLSLGEVYPGTGAASYYQGLKPARSSKESYDEAKAAKLWDSSVALWQRESGSIDFRRSCMTSSNIKARPVLLTTMNNFSSIYHIPPQANRVKHMTVYRNGRSGPPPDSPQPRKRDNAALQSHVAFFDTDGDGIIWPSDTCVCVILAPFDGLRALGLGILVSFLAMLLIHGSLSWITYGPLLPDPLFRLKTANMHRGKHGSDTESYTSTGAFDEDRFDYIFDLYSSKPHTHMTFNESVRMVYGNRNPFDPFGWTSAALEWTTAYLLLRPKGGRMKKEDIRAIYDVSRRSSKLVEF
ncbi:hypothetical protein DXG01_009128 [Tephrocybe rancida]|nr:hypothetical protein DXG01_009128 [Tephrocybe rancida]